jgi:putative holliday junction resolvase
MHEKRKRARILGVDYGLKRIGLALSDESKIIASPLETLTVSGNLETVIKAFLERIKIYELEVIVIGLPLKLNRTDSQTTEHVRKFAEELQKQIAIPIELFDERLTTVQADRALMEADFSRKKRAQLIDRLSAVILLQNYLDMKGIKREVDSF